MTEEHYALKHAAAHEELRLVIPVAWTALTVALALLFTLVGVIVLTYWRP